MEACAGAHYWAREIAKLGHHVHLIAPAYVKPFIKRQKNDPADAALDRRLGFGLDAEIGPTSQRPQQFW
jgi:transposase